MMVALLIYSYSVGERSSRMIDWLCELDIAFRSITGNLWPDHSRICRFRKDFEEEIAGLFLEVLRLCQEAKLSKAGVVDFVA
jgi:transposase